MQVSGISIGQNLANGEDVKFEGNIVSDYGKKVTSDKNEWEIKSAEEAKKSGYDKPDSLREANEYLDETSGMFSAEDRKRSMVILAEQAGDEEIKALGDEKISISDFDSRDMTTVVEKIQAKMVAAGKDLGMAEVSSDAIEQAAGSEIMATAVKQALSEADQIEAPDRETVTYLIKNDLKPTVHNIYMAEHSVVKSSDFSNAKIDIAQDESLKNQVEKVIVESGKAVSDESFAVTEFLINNDLEITPKNINYVYDLENMTLPKDSGEFAQMMAKTMALGENPKDTMLIEGYDIKAVAKDVTENVAAATDTELAYLVSEDMAITPENIKAAKNVIESGTYDSAKTAQIVDSKDASFIKAKRVLEETRLLMSEEANLGLLKKGVHIETDELAKTVENLKKQESDYYRALFGESEITDIEAKTALYNETIAGVEEVKSTPMYVLGVQNVDVSTILDIRDAGREMSVQFEKANQSYETLMTEVRPDLGDNIKMAFRNVDDIIKDMGLEATEANERAVRILGYNSIEITEENIFTMKAADETVQRTFSNMTPAVVREMIKQGENPLDMNLTELNAKAEEIKGEIADDSNERFSSFLYKLDHNGEITESEKQSFIGIFRLIEQVTKSDGSVIGALVESGRELSFSNLLSAMRSEKKAQMDVTVDDDFGGVNVTTDNAIDTQIQTAYRMNVLKDISENISPQVLKEMTEHGDINEFTFEQMKQAVREAKTDEAVISESDEYADYELQNYKADLEAAKNTETDIYRLLDNFGITNNVNNVLAMNALVTKRNTIFNRLFEYEEEFSYKDVDFDEIKEGILEKFSESLKTPEEMAEAQNTLAERAEHAMDNLLPSAENVSELDIRQLKMMQCGFSIANEMAKNETYTIPVMVGDEMTGMTLKLVHGKSKKSFIDIMFETASLGKVAISAQVNDDTLTGLFASDNEDTVAAVEASGLFEDMNMSFTHSEKLDLTKMFARLSEVRSGEDTADESTEDESTVSTRKLYSIAKDIMESIKKLRL